MRVYVKGTKIEIPFGPAGPDGNPVGTIISFLGTKAPDGYLVCDGSTLQINDYQDLAFLFEQQFGSMNHFGGDGVTTFAIPDLRNKFLRGYHNDGSENLSGDIGKVQKGTVFPNIAFGYGANDGKTAVMYGYTVSRGDGSVYPEGMDTSTTADRSFRLEDAHGTWDASYAKAFFTSRPVNVAVLYCIKAVNGSEWNADTSLFLPTVIPELDLEEIVGVGSSAASMTSGIACDDET